MIVLTAGAAAAQIVARARHVSQLKALAATWKMHFSAGDRFRLAPRVAERLPVPGAAGVRVFDLIYGIEQDHYRYLFSTEYTVGVLRTKTGCRQVATFTEPREPGSATKRSELLFAPADLPMIEQYRRLAEHVGKTGE
jgi:hypothetical protein